MPSQRTCPTPQRANLLVLRHGETNGNARRILQTPDTQLNERGRHQAHLAAQRIVAKHGTALAVRSSDYSRARQTAEALARLSNTSVTEDHLLRERNLGEIRGRSYAELGFDPFGQDYHPPAGESWTQFFARVAMLWARLPGYLADVPEGHTLVLVTHGLVCRALANNHLQRRQAHYPPHIAGPDGLADHWPNTSITELRFGGSAWQVHTMNCGRHLDVDDDPDDSLGGIA